MNADFDFRRLSREPNGGPSPEPIELAISGGHVLLVAPEPFFEGRGTPIAVKAVLETLSQLGRPVDLLTFPSGDDIELPGLRIYRTASPLRVGHVPIGLSFKKVLLDIVLTLQLAVHLARRKYSVIHAVQEAAFPAAVLGKWTGTPVIYDMQSMLSEQLATHRILGAPTAQRFIKLCERWLVDHVSCVSCYTGLAPRIRSISSRVPVFELHSPGQTHSPKADDIRALRQSLAIPPLAPVILYVGSFAPYQCIPVLIHAIPLVLNKFPQAMFVLVGARDARDFEMAKDAGLDASANLRIVPRQPHDAMPRYLGIADVVLSPRDDSGNLPLKIFDYMALGKPIVASDSPSHRSVLNEDRAVLVKRTPEGFSEGILDLLSDPRKGARLGRAAQQYSDRELGRENFERTLAMLYRAAEHFGVDRKPA